MVALKPAPILGRVSTARDLAGYDQGRRRLSAAGRKGTGSMSSASPMSTIVYECPSCRAKLRTGSEAWRGWLRCPGCNRALLPPEPRRQHATPALGDVAGRLPTLEPESWVREPSRPAWNPLRLVLVTGLVFSLFMTLVSFLDQSMNTGPVFRVLSVVFLVLLFRPRRRSDQGRAAPGDSRLEDGPGKAGDCQNRADPT